MSKPKKSADVTDKNVKTAERQPGEDDLVPFDASDAFLADVDDWEFGTDTGLVQSALDNSELAKLMAEGFECEQYCKIPDGGRVTGYFLGKGTDVMMKNPQDPAEMRPVGTWRIRHTRGNIVMVIPSSAQLDGKLGPVTRGELVMVQRLGQTQTGNGRRVNNFAVFHNPSQRIDVSKYDEKRGTEEPKVSTAASA